MHPDGFYTQRRGRQPKFPHILDCRIGVHLKGHTHSLRNIYLSHFRYLCGLCSLLEDLRAIPAHDNRTSRLCATKLIVVVIPLQLPKLFHLNHSTPSPLHIFTHHNLTSLYPCTRAPSFNYLPSNVSKYSQRQHGYTCKVNQGDILHLSPAPSKTYKNLLTCSRASSQPHQSCAAI